MKLIYGIEDKPKFSKTLVFAFQQMIAIMAATLLVPLLVTSYGLQADAAAALFGAGIGTIDEKGLLHEHKGRGLVPDVFAEANLQALPGTFSLGHVRYSTTGRSAARNAQPFVAHYQGLDIPIAHNGNLINAMELREQMEYGGAIFHTSFESEIVAYCIARGRVRW